MVRAIVIIGLVLRFSLVIAAGETCSKYVEYLHDEGNNRIEAAIIEIPSAPIGVDLQLQVEMAVTMALPPRYFLKLGLAQSEADSVRAIYEGKPLRYRINIPPGRANPIVYSLSFNYQQLCREIPAIGGTITTIDLQYTIPTVVPQSVTDDGNVTSVEPEVPTPIVVTQPTPIVVTERTPTPIVETQPTPTVATQPTPTPTVATQPTPTVVTQPTPIVVTSNPEPTVNQECGRSATMKTVNQLVVRGLRTSPGQFPWLVAIFTLQSQFVFQCGGTLVSNTHVITAAHCFEDNNGLMSPNLFHVSAGRYRLRNWRERGSVNRNLIGYRIHPDYKTGISNADADLAILILSEEVEFSPLIQPICLWSHNSELNEIVGQFGYVVGWGEDEFGNTYVEEPRMSRPPIVSQEDCLWSHPVFSTARSKRTFCAGARDGSGPCNGDSGSGLVLQDAVTGRFYLRGVVSLSLRDAYTMRCDLTQYVVYVDIAKHLEWVKQQIAT